jgi:predicted transcriptional regulator
MIRRNLTMATAKDDMLGIIQKQPDDSTAEEIFRELAFHLMVERGLADSDAGRTIPHEEMKRRVRSWKR